MKDINVKGYSLIELLIALMITTVGLISTVSLQASAKLHSLDATQRVIAMQLAQDMLARIQLNITQRAFYQATHYGQHPIPITYSCLHENCNEQQLTNYDKAQWNNLLLGIGELGKSTGLALPRACILIDDESMITILVSWRGSLNMNSPARLHDECKLQGVDIKHRRYVSIRTYLSIA